MESNKGKQQEFWMALIKKYEKRNEMLEQQTRALQSQLVQQNITTHNSASITSRPSNCDCNPCTARKSMDNNDKKSLFSLSSADLQYMLQLKELVDHEKEMKQKINTLQQGPTEVFRECICENPTDLSNNLLEENKRITDELKDLKLEMKQCIEKIEGPISRQIEKEKIKNKNLENELLRLTKDAVSLQQSIAAETDDLRYQLSDACRELSAVSAVNSKLKDELSSQKSKRIELEGELIDQKLAEAEKLKRFKGSQNESVSCPLPSACRPCTPCVSYQPCPPPCPPPFQPCPPCQPCPSCRPRTPSQTCPLPCPPSYPQSCPPPCQPCTPCQPCPPFPCICQCSCLMKLLTRGAAGDKDDSLGGIGKRLAAALSDVEQCPCCQSYIPEELKDTCKCIKELVDLVDTRGPKEFPVKQERSPGKKVTEERRLSTKSTESGKTVEKECTCQTEEEAKETRKVQAEQILLETEAETEAEKTETATITEEEVVEEATITEVPETQEVTAETIQETTEAEIAVAPETKEIVAQAVAEAEEKVTDTPTVEITETIAVTADLGADIDVNIKSEVNIGRKKSASVACSALRSHLEKTCSAICSRTAPKTQADVDGEEGEIKTQIELYGEGVYAEVGAQLLLADEAAEGTQVTTTITASGTLEVITEGPAGIIETTMTYTDSGNVEILTEITEYEEADTEASGLSRDVLALEGASALESQESGVTQGTTEYAPETAYSADISAISSKITSGTFQPPPSEREEMLGEPPYDDATNQQELEAADRSYHDAEQVGRRVIGLEEEESAVTIDITSTTEDEKESDTTGFDGDITESEDIMPKIESEVSDLDDEQRSLLQEAYGEEEKRRKWQEEEEEEEKRKDARAVWGESEKVEQKSGVGATRDEKEEEEEGGLGGRGEGEERGGGEVEEERRVELQEKSREKAEGEKRDETKWPLEERVGTEQREDKEGKGILEWQEMVEGKRDEEGESREIDQREKEDEVAACIEWQRDLDTENAEEEEEKSTEEEDIEKAMEVERIPSIYVEAVSITDLSSDILARGEVADTEISAVEHIGLDIGGEQFISAADISISATEIVQKQSEAIAAHSKSDEQIEEFMEAEFEELAREEEEVFSEVSEVEIDEQPIVQEDMILEMRESSKSIPSSLEQIKQEESPAFVEEVAEKMSAQKSGAIPYQASKAPSICVAATQSVLPETIQQMPRCVCPPCLAAAAAALPFCPGMPGMTTAAGAPAGFPSQYMNAMAAGRTSPSTPTGQPQRIVTEQTGTSLDTDALKKDVANALMRANKNVLDALDDANKHVMGALETANRDVNNALAALEDLNVISRTTQDVGFDGRNIPESSAYYPANNQDPYLRQQDLQTKMLAELEAAKRAAEECRIVCAEYMKEQFKPLSENSAAASPREKAIEAVKPDGAIFNDKIQIDTAAETVKPDIIVDDSECRKTCEALFKQLETDKTVEAAKLDTTTDDDECKRACEALMKQMQTDKAVGVTPEVTAADKTRLKQMQTDTAAETVKLDVITFDDNEYKKTRDSPTIQVGIDESVEAVKPMATTDESECKKACEEQMKQMQADIAELKEKEKQKVMQEGKEDFETSLAMKPGAAQNAEDKPPKETGEAASSFKPQQDVWKTESEKGEVPVSSYAEPYRDSSEAADRTRYFDTTMASDDTAIVLEHKESVQDKQEVSKVSSEPEMKASGVKAKIEEDKRLPGAVGDERFRHTEEQTGEQKKRGVGDVELMEPTDKIAGEKDDVFRPSSRELVPRSGEQKHKPSLEKRRSSTEKRKSSEERLAVGEKRYRSSEERRRASEKRHRSSEEGKPIVERRKSSELRGKTSEEKRRSGEGKHRSTTESKITEGDKGELGKVGAESESKLVRTESARLRGFSHDKPSRKDGEVPEITIEEVQPRRRSQRISREEEQQRPCSEGSQSRPRLLSKDRRSKTPPTCECPGDCECEICAPEKMAEKLKRQKARRSRTEECTCLPDCQCSICSANTLEKRKHLPSGDQIDKKIRGSCASVRKVDEQCHPPDCSCVSCLCDPCENKVARRSRELCHSKNCRCDECLCVKTKILTDKSRHPPECYCLDCLCEICPSLQKYEELARCEATCFDTKVDIDVEIGIIPDRAYVVEGGIRPDRAYVVEGGPYLDIIPEEIETEETTKEIVIDVSGSGEKGDYSSAPVLTKKKEEENEEGIRVDGETEKVEEEIEEGTQSTKESAEEEQEEKEKAGEEEDEKVKEEENVVVMDDAVHPEDCICPICQCPGADLVSANKKHGIDCDCPECQCPYCPGIVVQTSETKPDVESKSVAQDATAEQQPPSEVQDQNQQQGLEVMNDAILEQKLQDMENENCQRKQEMEEIKNLLEQIRCACAAAEINAMPNSQPQRAVVENTMSGLQLTLANLQEKCRAKDQMIEVLTKELRLRASSKVFNDMLKNIATGRPTNIDYDRIEICATLPRPKDSFTYGRPSHRLQKCDHPDYPNCSCAPPPPQPTIPECSCPTPETDETVCPNLPDDNCTCGESKPQPLIQNNVPLPKHNTSISSEKQKCVCDGSMSPDNHSSATGDSVSSKSPHDTCLCPVGGIYVDPSPLRITEARQVSPDSLILKWIPPQSPLITGYEIEVDGIIRSRVHSIDRTSAIIHGLIFKCELSIDLYAVSKNGRCLPPAKTLYKSKVCSCL